MTTELQRLAEDARREKNWITKGETYSDYFVIERSTDGKNFKETGRVNGAGDNDKSLLYTYLDREPVSGNCFYRLRGKAAG